MDDKLSHVVKGQTNPATRNTRSFVTALESRNIPEIMVDAEDRQIDINAVDENGQSPISYALTSKERYIVMTYCTTMQI